MSDIKKGQGLTECSSTADRLREAYYEHRTISARKYVRQMLKAMGHRSEVRGPHRGK